MYDYTCDRDRERTRTIASSHPGPGTDQTIRRWHWRLARNDRRRLVYLFTLQLTHCGGCYINYVKLNRVSGLSIGLCKHRLFARLFPDDSIWNGWRGPGSGCDDANNNLLHLNIEYVSMEWYTPVTKKQFNKRSKPSQDPLLANFIQADTSITVWLSPRYSGFSGLRWFTPNSQNLG